MNDLTTQNFKEDYDTDIDDTVNEFWLPALSVSNYLFRGVGYFSSSSFKRMIKGLHKFLKKDSAKIQLIVGHIYEEDFEAIERGYELQKEGGIVHKIIEERLSTVIQEMDEEDRMHIDLVTHLIASKKLDIKIAITNSQGIFHKKLGLFLDENDNGLVTKGSDNQTHSAVSSEDEVFNIEEFDVYRSWKADDVNRFNRNKKKIEDLINGIGQRNFKVFDFPEALKIKFLISRLRDPNYIDPESKNWDEVDDIEFIETSPEIPDEFNGEPFLVKTHQDEAIKDWFEKGGEGILEHATGSGKTITSIVAATSIYENELPKLALIIAVPYQELVDQWADVLRVFSWNSIKCYKNQSDWQGKLSSGILDFTSDIKDNICIIVTNKTLRENSIFQDLINGIDKNYLMFIGDECHHHSTESIENAIPKSKFKLGLSATPFHYRNDIKAEITKKIYNQISHTYTLKNALDDGILSSFRYEVAQVFLTLDERETYKEMSARIAASLGNSKRNSDSENLSALLAERARFLTSSQNKIPTLLSLIEDQPPKPLSLFYVGDGRLDDDETYEEEENANKRQIDAVSEALDELNWGVSQFSYNESSRERRNILENFENKMTDAIIAIKCLDEGIDIPLCERAYLLASSRDKRQYIQRSGRVLRKSEGKKEAIVTDFLMFPPVPEDEDLAVFEKNLILNELKRAEHFIEHSNNKEETITKINEMLDDFDLDYQDLIDEDYNSQN